jgi:VWFA-related protein
MEPMGRPPVAEPAAVATSQPSRTISLDVEVADKNGASVADLHTDDFTVLDNRQQQSIASVQAVGITSAQREAPAEVILAIDAINVGKEMLIQEFDWLHKYLDGKGPQLDLPTSFAFLEDQAFTMQNHPTRDAAALARFLESNRPGLRALRTSSGRWGAVERERISLHALEHLAAQAEKRPGRKLLLWIGPGWGSGGDAGGRMIGKGQQNLFTVIVSVWNELRDARITLDMVDPTVSGGRIFDFNYKVFLKGASEPRNAVYGDLLLPALAAQSGGQVLYGSTDLPGLIDRCVADAHSYYVVTYVMPPAARANEYHAVDIKIGQPGASARTRAGYYAQP